VICPDCGKLRHPGRPCADSAFVPCPSCGGAGSVEIDYEVGGYSPDRWMEIRTRLVECDECGGSGEVAADPWEENDA
jgi:DnaJ-class molecular chaperone